jgi:hypothetical protein
MSGESLALLVDSDDAEVDGGGKTKTGSVFWSEAFGIMGHGWDCIDIRDEFGDTV